MRKPKRREARGGGEGDLFKRLPDDLIVSGILHKISDANSLCMLSMASKDFSSLVFPNRNEIVSLRIPTRYMQLHQEGDAAFDDQVHQIVKFLGRFTSMRSLKLGFDFPCNQRWIFKFNWTLRSGCSLVANSTGIMDERGNDRDDPSDDDERSGVLKEVAFHIRERILFALPLIQKLVTPFAQTLQNLVLVNSKNQFKFLLGDRDLVEARNDPDAKLNLQWRTYAKQVL